MDIQGNSRHTWVRLGAVYGAVVDEKLAAVVYHAETKRGQTGGPGGNGAVADPAWYLVWSHEPHKHFQLSAPPRNAGDDLHGARGRRLRGARRGGQDHRRPGRSRQSLRSSAPGSS